MAVANWRKILFLEDTLIISIANKKRCLLRRNFEQAFFRGFFTHRLVMATTTT
jgi:hypothetical protein